MGTHNVNFLGEIRKNDHLDIPLQLPRHMQLELVSSLMAPDKKGYPDKYFFLFLHEKRCCGYSLEVPWQGASNEYPQHTFSWRIRKMLLLLGL